MQQKTRSRFSKQIQALHITKLRTQFTHYFLFTNYFSQTPASRRYLPFFVTSWQDSETLIHPFCESIVRDAIQIKRQRKRCACNSKYFRDKSVKFFRNEKFQLSKTLGSVGICPSSNRQHGLWMKILMKSFGSRCKNNHILFSIWSDQVALLQFEKIVWSLSSLFVFSNWSGLLK